MFPILIVGEDDVRLELGIFNAVTFCSADIADETSLYGFAKDPKDVIFPFKAHREGDPTRVQLI